jgi:heat shock protein HslJ
VPRFAVTALAAVAIASGSCSSGAPSRALDNSSWTLESIGGTEVTLDVPPTLIFRTGGTFWGFAGCNDFFGDRIEIGDGTIEVERLGATTKGCDDPGAEPLEMAYLDALQQITGWSLAGDTLTITGSTELVFSRRNGPPTTPTLPPV